MENLIKTILPTVCVSCGRLGDAFCYRCAYSCVAVSAGVCIRCRNPSVDGMTHVGCADTFSPTQLFSCFGYMSEVRKCIKRVKSPPHEFAALQDLSSHGISFAMRVGYYLFDYVVVPVPLGSDKGKKGFNENYLLAEKIAHSLGLRVDVTALVKVENDLFFSDLKRVCNKEVLLVDTVCITGRTLFAASKALYAAGAKQVRCFTLARVI